MLRLLPCLFLAGLLAARPEAALAQGNDVELLKKEIELLKRELDLLKRENDILKRENAVLKKGDSASSSSSSSKSGDNEPDATLKVTVDNVEYVYLGSTRSGSQVSVTVLATSKEGNQSAPKGSMTIVDENGDKYVGRPSGGVGTGGILREGVPTKLTWVFGAPNAFTGGKSLQPAPSAKITRYSGIFIQRAIAGLGDNTIDFRNVPAVITKAKTK